MLEKDDKWSNITEFDAEEINFDKPPTPPLAHTFVDTLKSSGSRAYDKDGQMNIEEENWQEGCDSKWKAY